MLETMKTNWKRVCEQLKSEDESSPYADEKKVLLRIEKNVYHRKTASPVVIAEVIRCGVWRLSDLWVCGLVQWTLIFLDSLAIFDCSGNFEVH